MICTKNTHNKCDFLERESARGREFLVAKTVSLWQEFIQRIAPPQYCTENCDICGGGGGKL